MGGDHQDDIEAKAPDFIDLEVGAHLRLLIPEDAAAVFETVDRNRHRLRRWLPWVDASIGPADTRAFIEATIATRGRENTYGIWSEGGFAGAIGLHTDPENRSAMIGYWLDEKHEGRGLVTNAARALMDVAFRDLSLHRVWLSTDKKNTRSCAVAERLGFRREGVHREDQLVNGRFRDTVIYAVLESDWPPADRT
jgi:ribosomal-protein-serine acetyltransferase